MSESQKHFELVNQLKDYVISNFLIEKAMLKVDIIGEGTKKLPTGYKPDLFYEYNSLTIIGEAKTSFDIDKQHSIEQYKSYMKYCKLHGDNSIFIVNVPWTDTLYIKKILKKIKNENNYTFRIIVFNDLKKVVEI